MNNYIVHVHQRRGDITDFALGPFYSVSQAWKEVRKYAASNPEIPLDAVRCAEGSMALECAAYTVQIIPLFPTAQDVDYSQVRP